MNLSRRILVLWVMACIAGNVANAINASKSVEHVTVADDTIIILEENKTLLDVQEDALYMWKIDTVPEPKQLKYFSISDNIDLTYLNVTPEFNLSPFKGTEGVWVYPHTIRFGGHYHAHFSKLPQTERDFFHKVEIRGYLHGNATLKFFYSVYVNASSIKLTGNKKHEWQIFQVKTNKINTFRIEIHTEKYGDFGFLDKVVGYYGDVPSTTIGPNSTAVTEGPEEGPKPTAGPGITTTKITTPTMTTTNTTTKSPTASTDEANESDVTEGPEHIKPTTPVLSPPSKSPGMKHLPILTLFVFGLIFAAAAA